MDFGQLYFNATGRISRKTWWLGIIGLIIFGFVLGGVAGLVIGVFSVVATGGAITPGGTAFSEGLMELAIIALLFAPYRSLVLKRLHDRNRPENLFWIFIGPSIVSPILMMLGLSGSMSEIVIFGETVPVFEPNILGGLVNVVALGVLVWVIVELGVMRGQDGPNEHGPDPLENTL